MKGNETTEEYVIAFASLWACVTPTLPVFTYATYILMFLKNLVDT